MKLKINQKIILLSLFFILSLSLIFNFDSVNAVTYIHNYVTTTSSGWGGNILWSERFTGLWPGLNVTSVGLNVTNTGSAHVRVKIFTDNATVLTNQVTHNNAAARSTSGGGNALWIQKYSGLHAGDNITGVGLNTVTGVKAQVKIFDNTGKYVHEATSFQCPNSLGFPCGGSGNFNSGAVFLTPFSGLPAGKTITGLVPAGSGSSFGHIRFYADDAGSHGGTNGYPYTLVGETLGAGKGFGVTGSNFGVIPADGKLWVGIQYNQSTALTYNSGTAGIGLDCVGSIGTLGNNPVTGCSDPQEWVGYTIYYNDQNSTGMPGNLISESLNTTVSSVGQTINLVNGAIVPSGGVVWAAWNLNTSNIQTLYSNPGTPTMNLQFGQTTGQHGPTTFNPWYAGTNNTNVVVYQYITIKGPVGPDKLLGESSSISIPSTGVTNYPISAIIPSNGNVWAAFEADNNVMVSNVGSNLASGSSVVVGHTYGTGPSTFTLIPGNDQTFAPWMSLTTTGPTLNVSPAIGIVGNTATLSGSNLGNNNNLSFTFNGHPLTTTPGTVTTNSTGGFSGVTFTVPVSPNGVRTINATNNAGIWADAFYTVNPSTFSSSPSSGNVGTVESFTGTGFSELDTITVKFDSSTVDTLTSDSIGNISGLFNIPSSVKGSHTITATDTHGNNKTSTFTTNTSISINPTSGSSGNTVTVKGDGFATNSNIKIYFDNVLQTTTPGTVTTNSTGSFSGVTFTVPVSPVNTYVVKVIDASSNQATQNFNVHQSVPDAPTLSALALSPTSVRFTSVAGASSGDNPVKWYGLICQINGGSWNTIVSNATLPSPRIYELKSLQPGDTAGCEWRDGSSSGWSGWSNEASTSTTLPLVQPPMSNNHLTTFIKWMSDHGGIYFGFTVGPFLPMLLGLMATPKTVGIFAIITLFAMGIIHASGLFVYPAWYWGLMILFGIVLVLSRANEKP